MYIDPMCVKYTGFLGEIKMPDIEFKHFLALNP